MTAVAVEPHVRLTPGGWLATTPPGASPRIGVIGPTEAEAIANYRQELARWEDLANTPDPETVQP